MLARSLGLERAVEVGQCQNSSAIKKGSLHVANYDEFAPCASRIHRVDSNLPNFLLCPLKIAADLMRISHTLLEALTCLSKTSLCLLL
jgi:hypothetical protein